MKKNKAEEKKIYVLRQNKTYCFYRKGFGRQRKKSIASDDNGRYAPSKLFEMLL